MSLLTNVHAENKSERRLSVFIFNLIIFIMSCFILVVYATQPFFKVTANAELSKETLSELIVLENDEINLEDALPESVNLSLTVSIESDVALNTAAKVLNQLIFHFNTDVDLTEEVTALLDDNISALVDQLVPELKTIALSAAKQVAIDKGRDAIVNALKSTSSDDSIDFEQKLDAAGITDEYMGEKMDEVITAITAEDATLDSVAEAVVNVVNSIVQDLNDPLFNADDDLRLPEGFNEETLTNEIVEILETFADEEGNIDIDATLAELFSKAMSTVSQEEAPQAANINGKNNVVLLSESTNLEGDETLAVKEDIRNAIMQLLGEDIHKNVGSFLKIASLILILAMASWLYLMIKIIVKLFMKDNTVRFKAPIMFGSLPGLLWLIPSIAKHFISKNPEVLANPYALNLDFFASGWIAVLGVLVLIVISAPYSALRKGLANKKIRKFK